MTNIYLEKIAEDISDENFDYIKGTPTNRLLTGLYGINSRLKDQGYDSNVNKVIGTSGDAMDYPNYFKKTFGGLAAGAALGAGIGYLFKKPVTGAVVGGLTGEIAGGGWAASDHWGEHLPAQLRNEINQGYYGKPNG